MFCIYTYIYIYRERERTEFGDRPPRLGLGLPGGAVWISEGRRGQVKRGRRRSAAIPHNELSRDMYAQCRKTVATTCGSKMWQRVRA